MYISIHIHIFVNVFIRTCIHFPAGGKFCLTHPATCMSTQELALWRGKILRMQAPDSDACVTVTDVSSGDLLFSGVPNSFQVHWHDSE